MANQLGNVYLNLTATKGQFSPSKSVQSGKKVPVRNSQQGHIYKLPVKRLSHLFEGRKEHCEDFMEALSWLLNSRKDSEGQGEERHPRLWDRHGSNLRKYLTCQEAEDQRWQAVGVGVQPPALSITALRKTCRVPATAPSGVCRFYLI